MTEELLSVDGLTKDFPIRAGFLRRRVGRVRAVDGATFSLRAGEALGLVGESGCGKSTLGRTILRLIEPTAGRVTFKGIDLCQLSGRRLRSWRRRAQMIFQDPYASLNPRHTIADNIGEALVYHRLVRGRQEQLDRVASALDQVGLSPSVMSRYPHQFSGGQQQRICIARALALGPELLVCDEVVSALDVAVQAQVLNLLSDLKEQLGLSYLFVAHDLSVVRHLCDRVAVLYMGRIVEMAPAEELYANPKHPYTRALLAAVPRQHPSEVKERLVLTGELPSAARPIEGCPFRSRCPMAREVCRQNPPIQSSGSHSWACIHD